MSTSPAIDSYTAVTVPTQFVEANGIRFAYRRWGRQAGIPLVFNQHFSGNLDNWDPAVLDGLAKDREVVIFNNAGVASSTGEVPSTFAGMARNANPSSPLPKVPMASITSASGITRYLCRRPPIRM